MRELVGGSARRMYGRAWPVKYGIVRRVRSYLDIKSKAIESKK